MSEGRTPHAFRLGGTNISHDVVARDDSRDETMTTSFNQNQRRHVKIGDATIYIEEHGHRDNLALVLLHGGMGNLSDFSALIEPLSENHHVVAIDSRGHGRSTLGSARLTYEQLTRDVIAIADALALPRFGVVGFSDGGIVGYRLALDYPSRISHLVTLGAPNTLPQSTEKLLAGVTAQNWDAKFPETKVQYEALNPEPDFERWVKASQQMWLDRSGYPGERVATIHIPTLIIRGDDDHLFSLDEAVELRKRIAKSRLLNVPFASHTVGTDQAETCGRAIKQFLASGE